MSKKMRILTCAFAGCWIVVTPSGVFPMAIRVAIRACLSGLMSISLRGGGHGGVLSGQGGVVRRDCFRGAEGSIWHHFLRSGIVVCVVADGKGVMGNDEAFDVVVRVVIVSTLLPFSGPNVGVGVRKGVGLVSGRIEGAVRSGVRGGLIIRGTEVGVRVVGGVIVVLQGGRVVLTASHGRDILCRLLLDRWDEVVHNRVKEGNAGG
jgi:hypothetical protein